jgi:hypothetical protein
VLEVKVAPVASSPEEEHLCLAVRRRHCCTKPSALLSQRRCVAHDLPDGGSPRGM